MESTKILLEDNLEVNANGVFYIYDSRYYFMYTTGERVDSNYIQLYVVQVYKDNANLVGMEIKDEGQWKNVQESIKIIIDDKKNNTDSHEIKYIPINMLVNLKIVSKNKFKLVDSTLKQAFNIEFDASTNNLDTNNGQKLGATENNDVIIDYRAKFFEEQEKNEELEERIKELEQKIESIRDII